MKLIGIATTVFSLGGVAVLLAWWQPAFLHLPAKSRTKADLSDEVRSLRADLEQLRRRPTLGPSQIVLTHPLEAPAAEAPPAPTPAASAEETFDAKLQRVERHAQATAESLERRLGTEPRDVAWGNESLARASESLTARVPSARILESSCASTVCRIVLSQSSAEDMRQLGNAIAESPPFDQGTFYRYDMTATPPKATLYVIREGHDLKELTGADTADLTP